MERPGELLEIERVAAALFVEVGRPGRADSFTEIGTRLGGTQGPELDPGQFCLAMCPLERNQQAFRRLARPHRQSNQHRSSRRAAQQRAEQLGRRRVRPVHVIEHEHQRRRRRELLEELANRTMAAVALRLERHLAACRQRRQ